MPKLVTDNKSMPSVGGWVILANSSLRQIGFPFDQMGLQLTYFQLAFFNIINIVPPLTFIIKSVY